MSERVTEPESLLTRKEACERLRISLGTIETLMHSGALPYIKIGGRYRIAESDLIAFLLENRKGA